MLQQTDPAARAKVQAVLAADKDNRLTKNDIAWQATWADVLRDKSQEARLGTSAWHAVRFKPDNPDLAAACFGRKPLPPGYPASRGPQDNCIVDKLIQFVAELKNPETSQFQRLAALKFVLNLVGDVNDPLNAIDRGDQGRLLRAVQIGQSRRSGCRPIGRRRWSAQVVGAQPGEGAGRLMAGCRPKRSNGARAPRRPGRAKATRSPRRDLRLRRGTSRRPAPIPGKKGQEPSLARRSRCTVSARSTRRGRWPRSRRSSLKAASASPAAARRVQVARRFERRMRVLVVYAHPLADSFAAALHQSDRRGAAPRRP